MTILQVTNSAFEARADRKAAGPARQQVPDIRRPALVLPVRRRPGSPPAEESLFRTAPETHIITGVPSVRLPKSRTLRGIGTGDRIGYL